MRRILLIITCLIVLLPIQAFADDGTYFDYEELIKISVDVRTPVVAIGDTVEFVINIENTTPYDFDVTWIEIFGYIRWEAPMWVDVGPGEVVEVTVSMPMPEPNHWYLEGDKYYQPISVYISAYSLEPYISICFEDQDLGRIEITNLQDGTGLVRMDILEEEPFCEYCVDKYGDSYQPSGHFAELMVTNISGEDIIYLDEDDNEAVLQAGYTYVYNSYSQDVYEEKNNTRNSVMVDYPFIFQIDGEYYAYKESRIYPTVHWDYNLDLKAEITRYEGEYKSTKEGYENYSVKITNTGDETIDGFYVAIGDAHLYNFNLANLTGRLDPGESEQFYFVHPSSEPELNIYAGMVFDDSVYYTNKFVCTNMDTDADEIEYDYWYNEYYPDMLLTITGEQDPYAWRSILRPQDLTSTEAYSGPEMFLDMQDAEETPKPTSKPEPTETKANITPKPTETPMTVTVKTRSLIPVWVYLALPLAAALVVGAVLFLRTKNSSNK
ncbi:MAG: hypothetical protein AB1Z19_04840 [Eubacteriales bacterium]